MGIVGMHLVIILGSDKVWGLNNDDHNLTDRRNRKLLKDG